MGRVNRKLFVNTVIVNQTKKIVQLYIMIFGTIK